MQSVEDDPVPLFREEEEEETFLSAAVACLTPSSYVTYFNRVGARSAAVIHTFQNVRAIDVISGIILGLLMAAFAIVFSSAIYDEVGLDEYIGLGSASQMISIILTGTVHVFFSDVGIAIASPDLNPAIFFGRMAVTCRQVMTIPGNPPPSQQAILATVLALMVIGTVSLGVILYLIGRLRLTRVMQMLPDSVLSGFMASIGYVVIVKGLRTAMPTEVWDAGPATVDFWRLALPAIAFGMAMYIHGRCTFGGNGGSSSSSSTGSSGVGGNVAAGGGSGNPAMTMPLLMCAPLLLFYIAEYAMGNTIADARANGWFFPPLTYDGPGVRGIYDASWQASDLVDWNAVWANVPQLMLLWIVIVIDVSLKIAGVRKALYATHLSFDHEMMLVGKANIITGFFVGAPGYNQPVLTVINQNIVRSKVVRISGFIAVVFNVILFVLGYPAVNFLPRFWLAGLVLFAAIGFIIEHLFESRRRFSLKEYFCVWLIVIVNAIVGLGWAILAGVVMAAFIFSVMYGRGGAIRAIFSGIDLRSSVLRPPREDRQLQHLGNACVVVVLHRYIFFGSATQIMDVIQGIVDEQLTRKPVNRVRYFLFDFSEVEDIDHTSLAVFQEMISKVTGSSELFETGADLPWLSALVGETRGKKTSSSASPAGKHGKKKGAAAKTKARKRRPSATLSERTKDLGDLAEEEDEDVEEADSKSSKGEDADGANADPTPATSRGGLTVCFTGLSLRQKKLLTQFKIIPALYDREYQRIVAVSSSGGVSDEDVVGLPNAARRVFDSLDLGLEWVEERLLEQAHHIRKRWMRFESFHRLHEQARNSRQNESYEDLFGYTVLGPLLGQFVERIEVARGSILWRAGDFNPQAYVVQSGRLTARGPDGRRVQLYRRGTFVNEDALYLDNPVPTTVTADEDTTVLALSRDNMRKLAKQYPEAAIEVHAHILQHAARTRAMLARMRDAPNLYQVALDVQLAGVEAVSGRRGFGDAEGRTSTTTGRVANVDDDEDDDDDDDDDLDGVGGPGERRAGGATNDTDRKLSKGLSMRTVQSRLAKSRRKFGEGLGLMDVSALNQGIQSGRRIAVEFSRQFGRLGGGRSGYSVGLPTAARPTTGRTLGQTIAMSASRHFASLVRFDQVDERVKADWSKFAPEGGVARPDDIVRVLRSSVTMAQAQEMVWEADLEGRGGISIFDFLDTITTVWEGEIANRPVLGSLGRSAALTSAIESGVTRREEEPSSEEAAASPPEQGANGPAATTIITTTTRPEDRAVVADEEEDETNPLVAEGGAGGGTGMFSLDHDELDDIYGIGEGDEHQFEVRV